MRSEAAVIRASRTAAAASDAAPSARIGIIEALRGGAALSVALFHITSGMSSEAARLVTALGWLGVDVFFVISGFVIPWSMHGSGYTIRSFPMFMLRRIVRLEPPYLVSILIVIALWHISSAMPGFHGEEPAYSLGQVASHVFYAIPLTSYSWLNPVYWSLAYEFVFYVLAGLMFPFVATRNVAWSVLLAGAIFTISYWATAQPDVRILEFLVGFLGMRAVVDPPSRLPSLACLVATLGCILVLGGTATALTVTSAIALIVGLRERTLGAWAIAIGSLSYALYLTHTVIGGRIVNLAMRFGHGTTYEVAVTLIALIGALAFALVFRRIVEAPALRASRRIPLAGRRQP